MEKRKKTPEIQPALSSLKKEDLTLTEGDIETYTFEFTHKQHNGHIYQVLKKDAKPPNKGNDNDVSSADLANEKTLAELLSKYSKQYQNLPESQKKPTLKGEEPSTDVKDVKELLKRITRYNNKRKYEERVGFASTIAAKAEVIGRKSTINFLLPAIQNFLVSFILFKIVVY